uniref:Large ribosomal subunit protein uL29 n=1 Tax=candidate division CPR3 bacterium TaxID=2268181 RepID=A0A7C4M168_UNCC3
MKNKEYLKDIREKKLEQLYKDVALMYKELRETRFKIANLELKDFTQKRKLRKMIAQVWTIIQEKEYENIINESKS